MLIFSRGESLRNYCLLVFLFFLSAPSEFDDDYKLSVISKQAKHETSAFAAKLSKKSPIKVSTSVLISFCNLAVSFIFCKGLITKTVSKIVFLPFI